MNEAIDYEKLQAEASTLPVALVEAMATHEGPQAGGLTLTREHIITINEYVNYVLSLPQTRDNLERWLGYTQINEPELTPESWDKLFARLRKHARDWVPLSDGSKKLSSELASTANSINASGKFIIDECRRVRALGNNVQNWQQVALSTPIPLAREDREVVTQITEYINVLRDCVKSYAARVEQVKVETTAWRDVIKLELIPAVAGKGQAIDRKKQDGELERLRAELGYLDEEIAGLKKEYDQYIKGVMGSAAAGPLGLLIGGSIYGAKAEKARKRRKEAEGKRREIARQLQARENLEGLLATLEQFVDDLDFRLASVLTAAAHLQTAWDTVDTYVGASMKKLDDAYDSKKLAIFIIQFAQFLSQWSKIEGIALELTVVFDEAFAAKGKVN
ncbi:alpha-xenorhabdolysin family binary toxin subunit A [Pseudomonas sp. NPDC089428]|uniref:alpha-xenorhabdolysin family binary toxin subunit A n=1 Tax=Pseudomonas sp. NPDC089428 TaxID=3364467 RepID=UPI0037F1D5FE